MIARKSKTVKFRLTHNAFFEETFKMPSLLRAFLRFCLSPELLARLDLENLTVETKKFYDEQFRETRPDMVCTVPILGEPGVIRVHIIFEHKSRNDRTAIYQISKYVHQLYVQEAKTRLTDPETKKRKPWTEDFRLSPVIPIILHHGSLPFRGETELSKLFYQLPGAEDFLPNQKAILVDLSIIEDDNLPHDETAPELHAVLMIMKVIFNKSKTMIRRRFSQVLAELKSYVQNPMYRDLIYKLRHYVIWNMKDITENDVFEIKDEIEEIIEEGDEEMSTFMEIFVEKGRVEGRVEGEARGKAEGEAEGTVKSILRILTRRFRKVPASLEARIRVITDLTYLEELADFAFDCESLEEFSKSLK